MREKYSNISFKMIQYIYRTVMPPSDTDYPETSRKVNYTQSFRIFQVNFEGKCKLYKIFLNTEG